MKNAKNKTLSLMLAVLAVLSPLSALAQDPKIDWVHGLNSSRNFWANYRAVFEAERRINGFASTNGNTVTNSLGQRFIGASYPTNRGVREFADSLQGTTNRFAPGLAVGHSMGGLAAREVARRDPGAFRGLIMCGSPLRGATVMNNIRSGRAGAFVGNDVWQASRGPVAQFGGVRTYVVAGVTIPFLDAQMRRWFLPEYGVATEIDLSEGSAYLNDINAAAPTVPRVMIWGDENSPIHFRSLSSDERRADNLPWVEDDDMRYVNIFNTMADVYNAVALANLGGAVLSAVFLGWGATAYLAFVAHEWWAGARYIRNDSESQYAEIIGANRGTLTRTITYTTNVCNPSVDATTHCAQQVFGPITGPVPPDQVPILYQQFQDCVEIPIQRGSDGTVPAYSALAQETNWQTGPSDWYRVEGCNHMEMRGHPNMTTQLNLVFNRPQGDPFHIPR